MLLVAILFDTRVASDAPAPIVRDVCPRVRCNSNHLDGFVIQKLSSVRAACADTRHLRSSSSHEPAMLKLRQFKPHGNQSCHVDHTKSRHRQELTKQKRKAQTRGQERFTTSLGWRDKARSAPFSKRWCHAKFAAEEIG